MVPFSFPLARCALWDPAPMGEAVGSHIAYYRYGEAFLGSWWLT